MKAQCACASCDPLKEKRKAIRRAVLVEIRANAASRRRCGADDPLIVRACRLLGDNAPPLAVVHVRPLLGEENGLCIFRSAAAEGHIAISPDSDAYKCAERGDAKALAGLLAHEHHHLRFGAGEYAAYSAQLSVLHALDADERHIRYAERSREARRDE